MLLRFSFENFRTFRDKTNLSMVASPQTTHNHILIREGNRRVLPTAILYGANASGKSNVILAMQTFCLIIQNGSINRTNNSFISTLELFPFLHDGNNKPIAFEIEFVENGTQFIYQLAFRVDPLNQWGERSIEEEKLSLVTPDKGSVKLFLRTKDHIELGHDKLALEYLGQKNLEIIQELAKSVVQNMDKTALFLTGGFMSAISKPIADIITSYIKNKVFPILDLSLIELDRIVHTFDKNVPSGNWVIRDILFDSIVKAADVGPQIIGLCAKETSRLEMNELELGSLYKYGDYSSVIPSSFMESVGTTRFLYFSLRLQQVISHGGIFLIDEMDNSIHPEIIKAILSIFCNPDINKHGAQLIFTSHNPIFMDSELLRQDQILFVEKDPDTYKSSLYNLSDYGSVSECNNHDFANNYFKGRYGRLPYIDLEDILIKAMKEKEHENEQAN